MKKILALSIALTVAGLSGASAQVVYKTIDQAEMNQGSLSMYALDGSGLASSGPWPIQDLNVVFSSPQSLTFSPNTITNTGALYYNPESGGVGSEGQMLMVSYLYGSSSTAALIGQTLTFEGVVSDYSLGTNIAGIPYSFLARITDFNSDFTSVITTSVPISSAGSFTVSQLLGNDPLRTVQWGLFMQGPNIWATDTVQLANAGSVTVVPEPSTYALLGMATLGGLVALRLRRRA